LTRTNSLFFVSSLPKRLCRAYKRINDHLVSLKKSIEVGAFNFGFIGTKAEGKEFQPVGMVFEVVLLEKGFHVQIEDSSQMMARGSLELKTTMEPIHPRGTINIRRS